MFTVFINYDPLIRHVLIGSDNISHVHVYVLVDNFSWVDNLAVLNLAGGDSDL